MKRDRVPPVLIVLGLLAAWPFMRARPRGNAASTRLTPLGEQAGKAKPRPSRRLAAVVVAAAIAAGLGTFVLVRDVGPPRHAPTARGGLIVLTDGTLAQPDALELEADVSPAGYPEDNQMHVSLTFTAPRPGLRWTLVASGDYRVAQSTPADAFCIGRAVHVSSSEVACPGGEPGGDPVQVHRRRELAVTTPSGIESILDYNGYEPGASSMITGRLPANGSGGPITVQAVWPIKRLRTQKGSSATYGALAPIAATSSQYGSLGRLASGDLTHRAQFVDATNLAPLNAPTVESVRFRLTRELGFQSVAQASPATASSDQLVWTDTAIRGKGMRFVLHDPFAEGGLLRRTFLGGVMGGLAASLVLWSVQLIIERRTRT